MFRCQPRVQVERWGGGLVRGVLLLLMLRVLDIRCRSIILLLLEAVGGAAWEDGRAGWTRWWGGWGGVVCGDCCLMHDMCDGMRMWL
jgi:hypothetical protein